MNDTTPTRSAAIALSQERRAMREGHAFLEEKCLQLAAAMLRELQHHAAAARTLDVAWGAAGVALVAALARHGLQGLQCYPAGDPSAVRIGVLRRPLLGVALQDARLQHGADHIPVPLVTSPEAEQCRDAFAALVAELVAMAAISGNLERLYREYRHSVRRMRALQDVLLPELDSTIKTIEAQLEELEQDEALWVRRRGAQQGRSQR